MDGLSAYSYGSAGWLTLQALPLIFTPSIVETLLSPEVRQITPLEEYFSRSLGFALLAVAALCLAGSGVFSSPSLSADATAAGGLSRRNSLSGSATLITTIIYHSTTAFHCYSRYLHRGPGSFLLGCIGSGALAAMGLWAILFGQSSHISRRTGADKRTSGWPFGNREADRKKVPKKRI